ncbi:uncharacterized protein LOC119728920 [Patiria miniata]|uniref:Autophagy-related protein 27 n=1 Tax=Patiria miniata TaxID=46514 RepID=A0A914A082_PATMI|nr:uncharacterized protein LOC119728920 [Patiria miniata]XP_038057287.1 uncharacterized protein LOC119728920 [Patiria miniata]XP_038057288.1 uncharacterized protein LOC119728920 [Patiria miniata]
MSVMNDMQNSARFAKRRCCNLARIMEFKFVFLVIALLQVLLHCAGAATCVKQDSCTCKFDDGSGVISLSTLNTSTNPDVPSFSVTLGNYKYGYNPCSNFSWLPTCNGVAVCQKSTNGQETFDVGDQKTALFNDAGTQITYQAVVGVVTKTTIVTLQCDTSASTAVLTATKEDPQNTYHLNLRSNCACKNGCLGGGLSPGSVLCIIFSVVVILYLVAGVLFLKFVRGAEGKELIPNYEFWKDLPHLIKDGVLFLAGGCKSDSNYEQI